jgi:hypothetical protein
MLIPHKREKQANAKNIVIKADYEDKDEEGATNCQDEGGPFK